jgi:hypothetical protein
LAPVLHQTVDKLRALAVAHYVMGGLICLFGLFPLLYVLLGGAMLAGGLTAGTGGASSGAPLAVMGGVFMAIGGAITLAFQATGISTIYAGMGLWKQERYTFCLVVAGLLCTIFPFGTVVGVLTLVCLCSPEGRMAYGRY